MDAVATHLSSGTLKVPTPKERGIELSIGSRRGSAAPKATPPDVIAVLTEATRKSADEAVLKDALDRLSTGHADAATFRDTMNRDNKVVQAVGGQVGIEGLDVDAGGWMRRRPDRVVKATRAGCAVNFTPRARATFITT